MKYIFWIAIVVAIVMASWARIKPEVVDAIFQDELQDIAAQLGPRLGVSPPQSDAELRDAIIRKAANHEIKLSPKQVTVKSSGPPEHRIVFIAVDYNVPVNLYVYSYRLHFSSQRMVRQ